jgi:putative heme-binding domain-containing protein
MIRFRRAAVCVLWGFLAGGSVAVAAEPGERPKITAVWPAGPLETRVAFDRAIEPAASAALVGATITLDTRTRVVSTRGEVKQGAAPADDPAVGTLRIAAARIADDGRTLVIVHDPHAREGIYTFSIPVGKKESLPATYDLTGVECVWERGDEQGSPAWSGWWPELNVEATRQATRGSVEHERGLALLADVGRLTLRTLVTLPPGRVTFRLDANRPLIEATIAGENAQPMTAPDGTQRIEAAVESTGDVTDVSVTLRTGPGKSPLAVRALYQVDRAKEALAVPRAWQSVAWAPGRPPSSGPPPALPDLSGGDRARGEALFYGDVARCANCHMVRGKGKSVGPDLTGIAGRDRASIYRDIAEPSAVIRPDYVPYTVALKDGRIVAGIVRADGAEAIRVTDTEARSTVVKRAEIDDLRPSTTSIMPVGLVGALGEARLRDLLAFLTAPQPPSGR